MSPLPPPPFGPRTEGRGKGSGSRTGRKWRARSRSAWSDPNDEHVDHRLLAGPFGCAAANGKAYLLAHLVLGLAAVASSGRRCGGARLLKEGLAILLDRNS